MIGLRNTTPGLNIIGLGNSTPGLEMIGLVEWIKILFPTRQRLKL